MEQVSGVYMQGGTNSKEISQCAQKHFWNKLDLTRYFFCRVYWRYFLLSGDFITHVLIDCHIAILQALLCIVRWTMWYSSNVIFFWCEICFFLAHHEPVVIPFIPDLPPIQVGTEIFLCSSYFLGIFGCISWNWAAILVTILQKPVWLSC